jgi:putative acetyltransferase
MIIIRPEQPQDIPAIYEVERRAFARSAEANLVDLLRAHARATLSLVAEEDGQIAGHVLYSPVTLRQGSQAWPAIGLGPVAVLPELQNRGIGSALIRRSLDLLRSSPEQLVFVEGNPLYYARFGFQDTAAVGIQCEFNPPPGCFMFLELAPGALAGRQGILHYSEEFQAVG